MLKNQNERGSSPVSQPLGTNALAVDYSNLILGECGFDVVGSAKVQLRDGDDLEGPRLAFDALDWCGGGLCIFWIVVDRPDSVLSFLG